MAAMALRNSKTALGAEYRRAARRKGASVAVFAMARKLATLVYRLLRYGHRYLDIGVQTYEERFQQARIRACMQTAKQFGFKMIPIEENVAAVV
jgi:hypothetical protein